MKKDPNIFLKYILECIREIENHLRGLSEEEFSRDIKTQDAVVRRIEVIGEAVKNLPQDYKKKNPTIDWRDIAGMRDKLIHHYFGVNMKIIWEVSKKDLPKLKKEIEFLVKK